MHAEVAVVAAGDAEADRSIFQWRGPRRIDGCMSYAGTKRHALSVYGPIKASRTGTGSSTVRCLGATRLPNLCAHRSATDRLGEGENVRLGMRMPDELHRGF